MRKLFGWIRARYRNLKINRKLLMAFAVLLCVPLIGLSFFSISYSNKTLQAQAANAAEKAIVLAGSQLNIRMQKLRQAANVVATNAQVVDIVSKSPQTTSTVDQVGDMATLHSILYTVEGSLDVHKIRLYVQDDFIYAQENVSIFPLAELHADPYASTVLAMNQLVYFVPTVYTDTASGQSESYMTVVREIKNKFDYGRTAAVLRLDVPASQLTDILASVITTKDSTAWLQTDTSVIAHATAEQAVPVPLDAQTRAASSGNLMEISVEANRVLLLSSRIDQTDWYLVLKVPLAAFQQPGSNLRTILISVSFLSILLAYLLAAFFVRTFSGRITWLSRQIQNTGDTLVPLHPLYESEDEIGMLIVTYNRLIDRIEMLLKRQYQMGMRITKAEMMVLQSQINPHFLYNTLDMVRHLSELGQTQVVGSVITALISFYRLSLGSGRDIVTLAEELSHVRNYVTIQQFRFAHRIVLDIQRMPDSILATRLPKITLQPLVENAIVHGILETDGKVGCITLSASVENGCVNIDIADNGVGADPAALQSLLAPEPKKDGHYSLFNTHQRIRLLHGDAYGLRFDSLAPHGLRVRICVPMEKMGWDAAPQMETEDCE